MVEELDGKDVNSVGVTIETKEVQSTAVSSVKDVS